MPQLALAPGPIERIRADVAVVPLFAGERPLRAAAGRVDWRLCGRLSRLVKSNRATAEAGETLLFPPGRRLPFSRILWFGLGDARGYSDDRFRRDLARIVAVVTAAGAADWALQAPGRASGLIGARRAIELLLEEPRFADQPLTLLEDPAGQKDIAELLRAQR